MRASIHNLIELFANTTDNIITKTTPETGETLTIRRKMIKPHEHIYIIDGPEIKHLTVNSMHDLADFLNNYSTILQERKTILEKLNTISYKLKENKATKRERKEYTKDFIKIFGYNPVV